MSRLLDDGITAIRTNQRVMSVDVPCGRVMSKIAFILHWTRAKIEPGFLVDLAPHGSSLSGPMEKNEGRMEKKKKATTIKKGIHD